MTQEQALLAAGYKTERIRKIFLNSDIGFRHFYLQGALNRNESCDELNQRYLRGAINTGCRAILDCLKSCGSSAQEVDFLAVCTCTGYVCPDSGSRLVGHIGFNSNIQRASVVGLGCAGALPTLQQVTDFVRANPGRQALMLAAEICSACYYVDHTLETVIGDATCADGASAFLLPGPAESNSLYPKVIGFETFLDSERSRAPTQGWKAGNCPWRVYPEFGWFNA